MNVSSRQPFLKYVFWVVSVLLPAGALLAQNTGPYKRMVTAANLVVKDTVAGISLNINLASPLAKHGDVDVTIIQAGNPGNPAQFEIKYTPDPGFIGIDTFTLEYQYIGTYPYLSYQAYNVFVYPTLITARPDFATTTIGAPVLVDVLANDLGSNPPLQIQSIPVTDHGSAIITANNKILFIPSPGFAGIAHLNYNVCDALNNCKSTSLSVGVNNGANPGNDTLVIATARNITLSNPLLYQGYTVFQAPQHGTVTIPNGHTFRYTPDLNYTGPDPFVLVNNSFSPAAYKTVQMKVLSTPPQNTMAIEDVVYTPKGQAISFNVRTNDIGNLTVKSWIIPTNLQGTVSGTTSGGNVTFTPYPGFSGVATFYYKIGNVFIPNLETGTVNVLVGNQEPVRDLFNLTTPVSTPLVINYKIPFTGFNFEVTDDPDHGTYNYYPGFSTQVINGQTISGNNLLVYTPETGFTGTDEFEIRYSIAATGQYKDFKVVVAVTEVLSSDPAYCVTDCVWTGDVNADGIVNNKDILPLGYFMGFKGPQRPNAALEWYGQHSTAWNNPFTGQNFDLKHCDTDGNGQIAAEDTLAIGVYYNQTDAVLPNSPPSGKGLPFFMTAFPTNPGIGDYVEVSVALGNPDLQVTDLYGFTFDVSISPTIVDSAMYMNFLDDSWINRNAPYLNFWRRPSMGRLESAFTRTNGISAYGQGPVAKFGFIIIDIIDITRPEDAPSFFINIDNPTFMWGNSSTTTGPSSSLEIPLQWAKDRSASLNSSENDVFIYPNPAQNLINIHLNGVEFIESLSVLDARGALLHQSGNIHEEHVQLDIQQYTPGIYFAKVQTATGQITKKFEVYR